MTVPESLLFIGGIPFLVRLIRLCQDSHKGSLPAHPSRSHRLICLETRFVQLERLLICLAASQVHHSLRRHASAADID